MIKAVQSREFSRSRLSECPFSVGRHGSPDMFFFQSIILHQGCCTTSSI